MAESLSDAARTQWCEKLCQELQSANLINFTYGGAVVHGDPCNVLSWRMSFVGTDGKNHLLHFRSSDIKHTNRNQAMIEILRPKDFPEEFDNWIREKAQEYVTKNAIVGSLEVFPKYNFEDMKDQDRWSAVLFMHGIQITEFFYTEKRVKISVELGGEKPDEFVNWITQQIRSGDTIPLDDFENCYELVIYDRFVATDKSTWIMLLLKNKEFYRVLKFQ
jgi:hypothetical protein